MTSNVYPCKPQFYCIKVGFKWVRTLYIFVMEEHIKERKPESRFNETLAEGIIENQYKVSHFLLVN